MPMTHRGVRGVTPVDRSVHIEPLQVLERLTLPRWESRDTVPRDNLTINLLLLHEVSKVGPFYYKLPEQPRSSYMCWDVHEPPGVVLSADILVLIERTVLHLEVVRAV